MWLTMLLHAGRPNGRTRGRHLDGRIDEVEYWFAPRDTLIDLGILDPSMYFCSLL